jgi:uncharacterized membrane protein (UPF0127 family)
MRKSNKKLLFLLVILAISAVAWLYFLPIRFAHDSLYIQSGTRLWPISIEIAKTEREKQQGLMFRRKLPENAGMLFISDEPHIMSMWMKNTYIPLDMLFIDNDGVIVCITSNARPRSTAFITCDKPALAVLELPGGSSKVRMIKPGDTVIHRFFDPIRRRK